MGSKITRYLLQINRYWITKLNSQKADVKLSLLLSYRFITKHSMFAHKYNLKEQELYFFWFLIGTYLLKNYNSLKKKKKLAEYLKDCSTHSI